MQTMVCMHWLRSQLAGFRDLELEFRLGQGSDHDVRIKVAFGGSHNR